MDLLDSLIFGFSTLIGWKPILVIITGVIVGIMVGAMPGLSPSTGVALLVPFSYTMSPALAVILLVSIYISSNYGGSITAVLINTPGTPACRRDCSGRLSLDFERRSRQRSGLFIDCFNNRGDFRRYYFDFICGSIG